MLSPSRIADGCVFALVTELRNCDRPRHPANLKYLLPGPFRMCLLMPAVSVSTCFFLAWERGAIFHTVSQTRTLESSPADSPRHPTQLAFNRIA